MDDKYFILTSGEDGTTISGPFIKDHLLKIIQSNTVPGFREPLTFLDKIPETDKGYWRGVPDRAWLIIRGEITIPRAVDVVKNWTVDNG